MFFFDLLTIILLGLVLGSFTTAIAYRIPRNIPWAFEGKKKTDEEVTAFRSACTSCKTKLKPLDLVPVFSWLSTRGACRYCRAPISISYPLTELGVVLACLAAYWQFGMSVDAFFLIALVPFLMALLVIDLEHMILPNELVLIVGAIGLAKVGNDAYSMNDTSILIDHGMSAIVYGGGAWLLGFIMTKILKKEALGFGDVKFFAVAGLWLSVENLSAFCFLSGLLGILFALTWQAIKKDKVFPFGPALIVAFYALLIIDGSLLL